MDYFYDGWMHLCGHHNLIYYSLPL